MKGSQNLAAHVAGVRISATTLTVALRDGREISTLLDQYPKLKQASAADRAVWEPAAAGHGIHRPLIGEDLSVDGLLKGAPWAAT